MFGAKDEQGGFVGRSGDGAPTLIARGVRVEGDFTSQGDVVIEGEVHGTLSCTGLLSIGAEAKIKADVKANDAIIAGTVEGNMHVMKHLDVKSSARIVGDVTCEIIGIENGASLSGKLMAGQKNEAHAPSTAGLKRGAATPSEAT